MLGFEPWDSTATDYTALGQQIKDSGAESVYLGGIVCNNGVKVLKDIRSVVGSKPVFVGPDGWTPYSATAGAGSAAEGMYISYAGLPLSKLGPKGKAFMAGLKKYAKISGQVPPYAVYQGHLRRSCRRDRTIQRDPKLRYQRAVQDERHERHHGQHSLRQER